jgi:hypothetical protein
VKRFKDGQLGCVPANTTKERRMNNKTEKPATPRTDVAPTIGYVLSVDRKLKTQFESSGDAMAAGLRLKQAYPVLQVEVFDATARRYTTVAAPEN